MKNNEITKKVMSKLAFNKENPSELISQLVKVILRDTDSVDNTKIISDLKKISQDIFKIWKR